MDLSKLPKLSQSPPPPADEPSDAPASPVPVQPYPPPGAFVNELSVGAEIWIAAIFGLIFMMLGANFGKYAIATLTGQTYHTGVNWGDDGPNTGEVPYTQLYGHVWLSDSAMFFFGLALIVEAIFLFAANKNSRHRNALLTTACVFAWFAVAYNVFACAVLFNAGIQPIMSLLVVAFGGYGAFYLTGLRRALRDIPPASR